MLALILMTASLVSAGQAAPDRNLDITREAERYAVPGRSFRAFERNVEDVARHGRYSFLRFSIESGSMSWGDGVTCRHDAPTLWLTIRFSLPRWTQYPAAGRRDRERYEAFEQAQIDYLTEFDALLVTTAADFLNDLRALPEYACGTDEGKDAFDAVGDAWMDAMNDVYNAFRRGDATPSAADAVCESVGDLLARCTD